MGETKGRYNAEFVPGTKVRTRSKERLAHFLETWNRHYPLQREQLQYADHVAEVEEVFFYHGDYELYKLLDVPGIWHEQCLDIEESSA